MLPAEPSRSDRPLNDRLARLVQLLPYGRWGGPPGGEENKVQAAQDLANQPRGKVALNKVVHSALPALKIPGKAAPVRRK